MQGMQRTDNMGCFSLLKTMMFLFNGAIFLGGAVILAIGIWVKVDGGSFLKILVTAAPQLLQVVNVGYLCIAIGAFLVLMGFLGCYGAMKESRCMLMIFFFIILIIFVAETAGAVVVLAFSSLSKVFIDFLGNIAVENLKNDYGLKQEVTTVWNVTMKEFNCCGFNGYQDFNNSFYYKEHSHQYPDVCCLYFNPCTANNISSQVKGCFETFELFLNKNGKVVGGVALGICALEIAAMIVSMALYSMIGNK
ncbi:tetraspanin-16 isoform X1 [Pelobates fuscus]|uniref:tetraspanin-16 isoform X1 n=2 Tax=Pelobates fuscus TaxID=191477 RepID=UPI002FE48A15